MLAASGIFPAVAVQQANLGGLHLLSLYVGQLGFGVAVASIGLACSSLTHSQIVAAVVAYALAFLLYDFNWIQGVVSEGVAGFLRELELQSHVEGFTRGVVGLRHFAYFFGVAAVGYTISIASLGLGRAR